ncbi:TonB-dependent siderophore receptor [Sphingomonas sp.]|uniref:TonB-dependent receptor plug domain-containing protein n=1 Tax=Sphingomonas sp. TaxID=28214 RepID=UPI0025DCC535|nr:TonB-dependent receptor [Sphingomonas sp.]
MSFPAFAQQGPQAAQNGDTSEATIIVTGTRIPRPEYDAPSPVVSLGADTIQSSGQTNLTNFLAGYPALLGSSTSADNAGANAGIGTTGINLLNLRNFGTQRTLVLVDGRRHVSGDPGSASVDINTIPTDLVERIDVLTGGASAVYGADAVSGVVNFVLKKNFDGISARGQAGISSRGDGGNRFGALTIGKNFADKRGNFALAFEHGEDDRLLASDRDYLSGTQAVGFYRTPYATGFSRVPLNNVRYYDSSRIGALDFNFDGLPEYDGRGNPWDPGLSVPSAFQQGGSGTLASDYGSDLLPQIRRNVINAIAHFDVSDKLTLFAEGKYAHNKSFSIGQPTFDYYLFVEPDNAYIPTNLQGQAATNGGFLLNRDNFDLGRRGEDITRETIRGVVGAKGEISPSFHYELSYVYGRTKVTNHYIGDQYNDRFLAALDAAVNPNTGLIDCRINFTPGYQYNQPFTTRAVNGSTFTPGQCVPLNLFGEGQSSAAARQFISVDTTNRATIEQQVVSGSISGDFRDLFSLPGGPIGFALGAEYRKEKSNYVPDPLAQQGLVFSNKLSVEKGSYDVKEAYAELNAPLLRNVRFAQNLEFGAAIRFSDYSTIGRTTTWKVDGQYAPIRDISIRGTYSQAVRAPNIGELFGGASQTFGFINDPCDPATINLGKASRPANCAVLLTSLGANPATFLDTNSSNIPGTASGNRNLAQEKAKTWTAGIVLQPRFLPGLNISADWYDLRLKNAISTVSAQELADLCVDQASINNVFCAAITRNNGGSQPGKIVGFSVQPQNVASYSTSGLDLNVNYLFKPQSDIGTFNIKAVGNYLHSLKFIGTPGAPITNDRDTQFSPKFQANVDVTWAYHGFTLTYGLNWYDRTRRYSADAVAGNPNLVDPKYIYYRDFWQHDIYASYDVGDRFQIYGGVNNFTDRGPDLGESSYPQSALGRYLFVGAKVKLASIF